MKINKIWTGHIKMPLRLPYQLSRAYGLQDDAEWLILKVYTDEGIIGVGESNPWPVFTGDTIWAVMENLRKYIGPNLIGKDPLNISMIDELLDSLIRGNEMLKGAINIACYDILGKSVNKPICSLISGYKRNSIKCFWAVGEKTSKEAAEKALCAKKDNFYGTMVKVGGDVECDVEKVIAVREAVGDDFPIIADANQGWDVRTAVKFCHSIEKENILFFEQPVPYWDILGMKKVKSQTEIPISADESITTIYDAKILIESDACDIFSIKTVKHGGILKTKRICDYANLHHMGLFFNSMHEGGISQAASAQMATTVDGILDTTGHSFFSTLRMEEDVTDFSSWIADGRMILPEEKAGLGVKLNDEVMERYLVEQYEII